MPRVSNANLRNAQAAIRDTWQSRANLSFFLLLVVAVAFVFPMLGIGRTDLKLYSDIVFSLLFISGVAIAWGSTWLFRLAAAIGTITVLLRWMTWFAPTWNLQLAAEFCSLITILVFNVVLLAQIFRDDRTRNVRIQGAVAVYLLFGVGWAHAYHIAAMRFPESFRSSVGPMSTISDWVYYSFVTLTTVGYGDIVPTQQVTRMLSIAEATAGQLYLAILIARLVSMELGSQQSATSQSL